MATSELKPSTTPSAGPKRGTVVLTLAALLVFGSLSVLISQGWRPGAESPQPVPVTDTQLRNAYDASPLIGDWVVAWRTASGDPGFSISEFSLASRTPLADWQPDIPPYGLEASELAPPMANRYVWSPDRTRFADYLASYGEPDSVLTLYNRTGNRTLERLAFCGTPCSFDDAAWLNPDLLAVLGWQETADGSARQVTLRLYDLRAQELSVYVSFPRVLTANPFDQAKQSRWELSQPPRGGDGQPNITVTSPADGSTVGTAFAISGQARTFEQNVRVRVTNLRTGSTLIDSFTTATAPDIGVFGPYSYSVQLPLENVLGGDMLQVEAFEESAEDGSEINMVTHVVTYNP